MKKKLLVLGGFLAVDLALPLWAGNNPDLVERYYARGLYPALSALQQALFGWLPFSVAEVLLVLVAILALRLVFRWLRALRKLESPDEVPLWLARCLMQALAIGVAVHLAFLLCWGLNYYRPPLAERLGYSVHPATTAELLALADDLILQANAERVGLPEDSRGVVIMEQDPRDYLQCLWGRDSEDGDDNGEVYLRAKPIFLSSLMSYTMITGFIFPYSGEANVNMNVPLFELPATVAHELAHQQGIAREDEANFVSWLKSRLAGIPAEVRYSGTLRALVYTLNAAARAVSGEEYAALWQAISVAVDRDLTASREFWNRYRGAVQTFSEQVNDTYLKSNQQSDGVQSYGRMVDLLLAERRQTKGE